MTSCVLSKTQAFTTHPFEFKLKVRCILSCQTWCNFVSKINVLICFIIFRNSHKVFDGFGGGERVCAYVRLQLCLVYLLSSLRSRRPEPASVTQRGWCRCSGRSQSFVWHTWDEGEMWLCCCPFPSEAEHLSGPSLGLVRERVFSGAW